ncbi:hypothetical protein PAEAM_13720 [Paenibacillus sp. GM1FR]|nr:hypothetical protein PAEAM_13720 [Paenibacillus sp. GM1FR]
MCVVAAILRLFPARTPHGLTARRVLPGALLSRAGGSLPEVPAGLMGVRLSETRVPGALLSRQVALSLRSFRASWTFAFFGHKKAPSLERDEAILALPP